MSFANAGCAGNDTITVTGANLGFLCLAGNYVNGNRPFSASPMVLSGAGTVVTITLGTPSGAFLTETVAGAMSWTPSASALDVAGNACSTTAAAESGAAEKEF